MTDLFKQKARDWDQRPISQILSEGIGKALLQNTVLSADMSVMDFGAGTGLICSQVAPHVERVLAVDISPGMLEKLALKEDLRDKAIPFCQDILSEPLDQQVDLIISAMALHHVEDTDLLLQRFNEHLETGGRIALADLDKESGDFHPADVEGVFHHGFERDQLADRLRRHGFDEVAFTTAVELQREGKTYPVFLVTAQKVNPSTQTA